MKKLKAIETEYKGIKFRSKLEAQWAVFFDECGADWEYEPEGFDLGNGLWYLPDFKLSNVPFGWEESKDINKRYVYKTVWIEVKGVMDESSERKIKKFSKLLEQEDHTTVMVVGSIPKGEKYYDIMSEMVEEGLETYFYTRGYESGQIPGYLGADDTESVGIYQDGVGAEGRIGLDYEKSGKAFYNARNYRFDHKNKGEW